MKYVIFVPIALIYTLILSLLSAIACLWLFNFKTHFQTYKRNINHKLKIGYWLEDVLGL
jgi:uncharacterized membrane protein